MTSAALGAMSPTDLPPGLEVVGDHYLPSHADQWYASFSRFRSGTLVRGRALLSARVREWYQERGCTHVLVLVHREPATGRPASIWMVGQGRRRHRRAMRIRKQDGYIVGPTILDTGIACQAGASVRIGLVPSSQWPDTLVGDVPGDLAIDPGTLPTIDHREVPQILRNQ